MSAQSISSITGGYFQYQHLSKEFAIEEIEKNYQGLMENYSSLTKKWSKELNSQWVLRDYMAIKMILSASVMLSSVEYANERNLRIVEPYLVYYSMLNCARAVVFTSPKVDWDNEKLFVMTHKKTINVVSDIIANISKGKGAKYKSLIERAREYRELFSYKFPASGISKFFVSIDEAIMFCQLFSEVAQYQSELLSKSIDKNVTTTLSIDRAILRVGYDYGAQHYNFIDKEDGYRLDYMIRKQKRPLGLHLTMTEGMVEDFFGAWGSKEDFGLEGGFNPDKKWQIIFPVP